jgi:hypothetical protein
MRVRVRGRAVTVYGCDVAWNQRLDAPHPRIVQRAKATRNDVLARRGRFVIYVTPRRLITTCLAPIREVAVLVVEVGGRANSLFGAEKFPVTPEKFPAAAAGNCTVSASIVARIRGPAQPGRGTIWKIPC